MVSYTCLFPYCYDANLASTCCTHPKRPRRSVSHVPVSDLLPPFHQLFSSLGDHPPLGLQRLLLPIQHLTLLCNLRLEPLIALFSAVELRSTCSLPAQLGRLLLSLVRTCGKL